MGEDLEDPKFSHMYPEEDRQDVKMIWMLETALILKKDSKLHDSNFQFCSCYYTIMFVDFHNTNTNGPKTTLREDTGCRYLNTLHFIFISFSCLN